MLDTLFKIINKNIKKRPSLANFLVKNKKWYMSDTFTAYEFTVKLEDWVYNQNSEKINGVLPNIDNFISDTNCNSTRIDIKKLQDLLAIHKKAWASYIEINSWEDYNSIITINSENIRSSIMPLRKY
jgi:hypothetical protein